MNHHEQEKCTWKEKIDVAEAAASASSRASGKEQNLSELLEKYQEEIKTLSEENCLLQWSSFSSSNRDRGGGIQEEVNAVVTAAVAMGLETWSSRGQGY
jgi:hypothetical protein